MATFSRSTDPGKRYVILNHGSLTVDFDTWFGGAPLVWKYGGLEVIASHPGEGFQSVINEGQDLTQATANGETTFHVHRTIDSNPYQNYYLREAVQPNFPTNATYYRVDGFYPDFWLSHEAIDDALPPFSNGSAQQGWITLWTYPQLFQTNAEYSYQKIPFPTRGGAAIFFQGTSSQNSGIFMEGNEIVPLATHWASRLRRIENGRIAFKVRISLSKASANAWAGVMFRRSVPVGAATMDQVFQAQGYSLNVNRSSDPGVHNIQLMSHTGQEIWGKHEPLVTTHVNSDFGCLVELRTFNHSNPSDNTAEVWVEQTNLTPNNPIDLGASAFKGPHVGLIAYTQYAAHQNGTHNYVKFCDRQIFNVGTLIEATFTPGMEGSREFIETDVFMREAVNVPSSERRKVYRVNTKAFLKPGQSMNTIMTEKPRGTVFQGPVTSGAFLENILQAPNPVNALYAGRPLANPNLGIYCAPTSLTLTNPNFSRGEHALVQDANNPTGKYLVHINAVPLKNQDPPFEVRRIRFKAKWFPRRP